MKVSDFMNEGLTEDKLWSLEVRTTLVFRGGKPTAQDVAKAIEAELEQRTVKVRPRQITSMKKVPKGWENAIPYLSGGYKPRDRKDQDTGIRDLLTT